MKNNFIWILGVFFLLSSCAKEEIVEKHDNGEAKLVFLYKEDNGKKIKVKEKVFVCLFFFLFLISSLVNTPYIMG